MKQELMRNEQTKHDAATKIASLVRGHKARMCLVQKREDQEDHFQRQWRHELSLVTMESGINKVQAAFRARQSRDSFAKDRRMLFRRQKNRTLGERAKMRDEKRKARKKDNLPSNEFVRLLEREETPEDLLMAHCEKVLQRLFNTKEMEVRDETPEDLLSVHCEKLLQRLFDTKERSEKKNEVSSDAKKNFPLTLSG
eukprot:g5378.t1